MKNLSFKINKIENTVTFMFGRNVETITLISENQIKSTAEQWYKSLTEECVTVEEDYRITNAGNKNFKTKTLIFRNRKGLPLISILKNNEPITERELEEIEEEYLEAVSEGRNDARNWRELFQKTTGLTAKDGIL